MNKGYCDSICGESVEIETTSGNNNEAGWTANKRTQMGSWLSANKFNLASLKDGTHTHVGIGCSCTTTGTAKCYMTFTKGFIGNGIVSNVPLWYDYSDGATCATKPATGTHGTPVSCTANEYYNGVSCQACSGAVTNCETCSYSSA